MATRAIYQIENLQFYNHWDNYPQGAALHLLDVFKKYEKMDVLSFVRGVDSVEVLSPNKFDVGEEYVYHLYLADSKDIPNSAERQFHQKEWMIEAYSVQNEYSHNRTGEGEKYIKTLIYNGLLIEWINSQLKARLDFVNAYTPEEIEDNTLVRLPYDRITTQKIAREKIVELYENAVKYFERGMNGNSTSAFHECFKMANYSGIDIEELKEKYIVEYAPIFAERYNHDNPKLFIGYAHDTGFPKLPLK